MIAANTVPVGRAVRIAAILCCGLCACGAVPMAPIAPPVPMATTVAAESFDYGRFGTVAIYRNVGEPRDVALFVSGTEGWNAGVISMAQRLKAQGSVVAGIDIRHYLAQLEASPDSCVSPADDFENLSRYLQSRLNLKHYVEPTLVGYSSGATLAYAALAEATDGMFKGALSIDFCPALDLKKPVCKGAGIDATPRRDAGGTLAGVSFLPARRLSGKWIVLQRDGDQACPAAATQKFAAAVARSEVILSPPGEQGYIAAYERITADGGRTSRSVLPGSVADLPLIVVPANAERKSPWFAVFLSGDGGWVGLDRGVSKELSRHGIAVVGWDSLKYFWSPRTPQGTAEDLDRVVHHYSRKWSKSHVLLIGYSQGADTMPFMVNRLPAQTRSMVGLTALLGISDNAAFEFHMANWLGDTGGGRATAPELQHWSGSPYLCLYGEHDRDAACAQLTQKDGIAIKMSGGHHFGGSYTHIADEILSRLPAT